MLQRKLFRNIESGKSELVYFNEMLLPLAADGPNAMFAVRFGLDAAGAYVVCERCPEGKIVFLNQILEHAELRISHEFFKDPKEPFRLKRVSECGYELHTLNEPSAFIDLVELGAPETPDVWSLGLECCANVAVPS